jgi:hypothetical protein
MLLVEGDAFKWVIFPGENTKLGENDAIGNSIKSALVCCIPSTSYIIKDT